MMEKEKDVQIRVRIPKSLKEVLEEFAKDNNNSFNQEVLSRLLGSKYDFENFHKLVIPDYLDASLEVTEDLPYKARIDILILIDCIIYEILFFANQIHEVRKQIKETNNDISITALNETFQNKINYISFLCYCLIRALKMHKRCFSSDKLNIEQSNKIKQILLSAKEAKLENNQINNAIDNALILLTEIS